MREIRIYTDQPLTENQSVVLDDNAARHLKTVLRVKPGQPVTLFNGAGGEYQGTITDSATKKVIVALSVHRQLERESPLHITLAIGISRGERMDWIVQKATELGVSVIVPLITERTEVKLNAERAQKKLRHWRQITISACEQSGRNKLPEIQPLQQFGDWLSQQSGENKFVLHHRAATPLASLAKFARSATVLIGPEGGLTEAEITAAAARSFQPLSLGPRVMRTETAPVAAISVLQMLWGDFV